MTMVRPSSETAERNMPQHLAGGVGVESAGWFVGETTAGSVNTARAMATRCC
jgi:glycerol uptake facilitator-like aquaporin